MSIYAATPTEAQPTSASLRYNECHVFIRDGHTRGHDDAMVGQQGIAVWRPSELRWYFTPFGSTENARWVRFHQLGFCPMPGDQVLALSSQVPVEYQYDRYSNNLEPQQIRDRLITVTSVEWSKRDRDGTLNDSCSPMAWVWGEVKSRQKPDDTEQVRFMAGGPDILNWMFPEYSSLGDEDIVGRNLAFHEFHLLSARLNHESHDKANFMSDVNLLGAMLEEEATDRSWCNEYDEFINIFNEKSKIAFIEPRSYDYEVEVEVEVTLRINQTVTTSAASADEARDHVGDMDLDEMGIDIDNVLSQRSYDVHDTDIHSVGDAEQL